MRFRSTAFVLFASSVGLAFSTASPAQEPGPGDGLTAFGSQQELTEYLQQIPASPQGQQSYSSCDGDTCLQEVVTTSMRVAPTSITNAQHSGVDEGDIVKQHGDHLVVLRRGRLFTIDISGNQRGRIMRRSGRRFRKSRSSFQPPAHYLNARASRATRSRRSRVSIGVASMMVVPCAPEPLAWSRGSLAHRDLSYRDWHAQASCGSQ